MAYKNRTQPEELIILRLLNIRMILSEADKQYYFALKKGYEGEVMFDQLTEKLQCECYVLNDLLLKVNNKTFQIDTLIILYKKILIFEVKNYEGDYFYEVGKESDRLYKLPKTEYDNPLTQLTRSDSLLRQMLQGLHVNLPIEANVVFIHSKFTLYQAPLDKPFIFPTQIISYLEKLDKSSLRLTESHRRLADKLISLHIKKSPFTQLPAYRYEQLRKGNTCGICHSFSVIVNGKRCVCLECGHEECVTDAVLRNVGEIRLLFPGMKITTNLVYEWCGGMINNKRISRILNQHFQINGVGPWAFYE
ncbi:nuclease-related domain-containing protein [Bacillus sp. FJAT-29814]|uniref:nuclease-related domain-containing protein n=1 Tax=Bacillus sp. FJAT-29814 TaxID=1729688 RepID=UPI00082A5E36|nr:nuclease-related domain-containing protein [Bacillus sp. FJAT-29814]